ncbi:hypothetical protein [Streptomyces sp. NPDC048357]|uniref:hypothetical protein n=1 Tax=Streptomyces sp. NPDC048357 TaxID=3154719 RepID=UPI00342F23DD
MCACGWHGAAEYPDWETIGDQPLCEADVDLSGPLADWTAHLSVIREAAVPLLCDDGMPPETLATALGTTYSKALVLLLSAQNR